MGARGTAMHSRRPRGPPRSLIGGRMRGDRPVITVVPRRPPGWLPASRGPVLVTACARSPLGSSARLPRWRCGADRVPQADRDERSALAERNNIATDLVAHSENGRPSLTKTGRADDAVAPWSPGSCDPRQRSARQGLPAPMLEAREPPEHDQQATTPVHKGSTAGMTDKGGREQRPGGREEAVPGRCSRLAQGSVQSAVPSRSRTVRRRESPWFGRDLQPACRLLLLTRW